MFFRYSLLVVLFTLLSIQSNHAQSESAKWVVGIGGGLAKFPSDSKAFGNENFNFQIPRIQITRYVTEGYSLGMAFNFPLIKSLPVFDSNSHEYFSLDGQLRYDFKQTHKKFVPYAYIGGSIITRDSEARSISLNAGGGATYWAWKKIGLNAQIGYKYVPSTFESNADSHVILTGAIVYSFGQRAKRAGFRRLGQGFCF